MEPARPKGMSGWGRLAFVVAAVWVAFVFCTVPISADRYRAGRVVKWTVAIGHLGALALLLFPWRGKSALAWCCSGLVGLFALLQLFVLLAWN
jgi:hypothetical protein